VKTPNFAFPTPEDAYCGLTKIEYVSCAILAAMIANPKLVKATEEDDAAFDLVTDARDMAEFAIAQARELLSQVSE
jgi:hypothetical protein